jgi:methyl-accepting chemotaxis protein
MNAIAWQPIDPIVGSTPSSAGGAISCLDDLCALAAELDGLKGPAEEAFLTVGSALGEASHLFGKIQDCFRLLVGRLDGSAATATTDRLEKTTAQFAHLGSIGHALTDSLDQLNTMAPAIESHLQVLHKIAGEVGALAINAKIQASQVPSGGADFSVFTTEIQRLGTLAGKIIGQACSRLRSIRQSVADAAVEARSFEKDAALQLSTIQERLTEGLALLADQHRATASAVAREGRHSDDTVQRVAACMTDLQFNDTACQRIEHVREALTTVIEMATAGEADAGTLVGTVCLLQAMHLSQTSSEYGRHVELLTANLRGIGADAQSIASDAEVAMRPVDRQSDPGKEESFVAALQRDVTLATALLSSQRAGRSRVSTVVRSVSSALGEMVGDLDGIHSIDADMRVMGLNATLKCSRLGQHGRALGVIAQELRGCSKRTEALSRRVADLLQGAMELAGALATQDGADAGQVNELAPSMASWVAELGDLNTVVDERVMQLHRDCSRVAHLLIQTADAVVIHHRMTETLCRIAARLEGIAGTLGVARDDASTMSERVREMLAGRYTMQSERLVHKVFADGVPAGQAVMATAAPAAVDDIDALLF